MATRYVTNADGAGWLATVPDGVKPEDAARRQDLRVSLPQFLKVDLLNTANGREYFKVLEGAYSGKQFSVKLKAPGQSYLSPAAVLQGAASVKLVRKKQELYYGAKGPFSAFTESANPVPLGVWDIEIPDAPHINYYGGYAKLDNTWFHIGHNPAEDRYLHCGLISHGCVTVRPLIARREDPRLNGRSDVELGLPVPAPVPPAASWDDLYAYLISARKGDGKSVGTITIVD